jgi:hypothetical protein
MTAKDYCKARGRKQLGLIGGGSYGLHTHAVAFRKTIKKHVSEVLEGD